MIPDGNYAIGMAGGRSTETTVQAAILVTGTEVALIESEIGGFSSQALGLVYREVQRVFETYLVELFDEIAMCEPGVLRTAKHITHTEALQATDMDSLRRILIEKRKAELTRSVFQTLEKEFEKIGLPIVSMTEPPSKAQQEDVLNRLRQLSTIRNMIEHNRSRANEEYLRHFPVSKYELGDFVQITVAELGDALSAVDFTADDINKRAIAKFEIASKTS